jgi:2-phospho-L-lactate guanylyltransferase
VRAILIPVKSFSQVKQRLARQLGLADRIDLVQAMRKDVFACVATVRGIDRVFVVTSEPQVLDEARLRGWEPIREQAQQSESASVDFASRWCAERGATALLRLPIDLPLVTAADVQSLFSALDSAPCAVLAPSRDGTGTNALLRSPPALFPSRFGPGSFALHLAEAERVGATAKIMRNPRIEFDLDDPEDLAELPHRKGIGVATSQWLRERGLMDLSGIGTR